MASKYLIEEGVLGIKNKTDLEEFLNKVENKEYDFKELVELFLSKNLRICQSASWPMGVLAANNPDIIKPYLPRILAHLDVAPHDAYKRNTFRFLQFMDVPTKHQGVVYDKCMQALTDTTAPTAIKSFAMTALTNLVMKIPELKEELMDVIYEQIPYGTGGFINRAKKELKRLEKL